MDLTCLSNNNKTMDMEVDLELEMKISRRELRVLLLDEFRLDHKGTEATSNKQHMQHYGQGCALYPHSAKLVSSVLER